MKQNHPGLQILIVRIMFISLSFLNRYETRMIDQNHIHDNNIIINHVLFPRCFGAGIFPLKLKLFYDEKTDIFITCSAIISGMQS
jgi:hypothetical protein